ncbi:MAG: nitroreductase/quinone reductase family protein [Chloroflexota bacterium]
MTDPVTPAAPGPALLPEPPGLPYAGAIAVFRALNRWFMVPLTRRGLGAWVSMPIGGSILLLRARGRKSGVMRETPLNYVVAEGSTWVLAGFGPRTEWYRNLVVDPRGEVVLPGRTFSGIAVEVRDPATRRRIMPAIMRSTAGPSMASGVNPFTTTDDEVLETMAWVPLVRVDADEGWLDSGPDDPGGHAWIWRQALVLVATVAAIKVVGRVLRALSGR